MAYLYVSEYSRIAGDAGGNIPMSYEAPLADYTVSVGSGSVQGPVFQSATRYVRLHSDSICSVLIGSNPTVTTSNGRMAANQTEYRSIPQGVGYQVAVIANS